MNVITDPIVDRVARAAQDGRAIYGETIQSAVVVDGREVACEETVVLHSPGPEARRELADARWQAQAAANRLVGAGELGRARALLIAVADAEHAMYPQYADAWIARPLGVTLLGTTFRGGRSIELGDAVLVEALSDEWGAGCWCVYSARLGVDACVPAASAREVSP